MPLKIIHEKPASQIKKIIGIAAGKGGVGKSTVTVNLARALKMQGFTVGILDADIYGPSIRKMLPEGALPYSEGEALYPAQSEGLKVMSMAYFREEHEAAAVRAPIASGLITQFLKDILWGDLDYLLIDFPPGTGDIQLTLCQHANLNGIVLVTTPQEVAILDVQKALHLFQKVKVPLIGVVENMSYYVDSAGKKQFVFGKGGGEKLARDHKLTLLTQIALDPLISESGDKGCSLFTEAPASEAVTEFLLLAEEVTKAVNTEVQADAELVDPYTLKLKWEDGQERLIPVKDLQLKCTCANCEKMVHQESGEDVKALSVSPVGRYAVRLKFSSGCSAGIYLLDSLR